VSKPWEISGDDLDAWASRIEAHFTLPKLVRRLLLATAPLDGIEMRADAGTRLEGWDGTVGSRDGTAFCPAGLSVWEMSVESGIKSKIEKDFEKRSKEPPASIDPRQATYVAVTTRRFPAKVKWVREKKALGKWADVRLYDADDLATWLEQAPAVGRWFAAAQGFESFGVADVESYLASWSRRTSPPLPYDLVLTGKDRKEKAAQLQAWLVRPSSRPLHIRADTREEAQLFAAAAIANSPRPESLLSRALVLESEDAWRWASRAERIEPLILLPSIDVDLGQAATAKAYVLIAAGRSTESDPTSTLDLEPIPHKPLARALVQTGRSEIDADRLVRDSSASLYALQKLYGYFEPPSWAKGAQAAELLAFLLAGAWVPSNEADREVISKLGSDSVALEQMCTHLLHAEGVPVERVQEHWRPAVWRWNALPIRWKELVGGLTNTHLERFREVVLTVLGASDPVYDMAKGERFYASIQGKVLRHSGALREGLVETMARLTQHDDTLKKTCGVSGSQVAEGLVYRLLAPEKGWSPWASLSHLLPTIAEASPNAFLDLVEKSLDRGAEGVSHVFHEEGDHMGPTPHTGLLWALETLGWSPDLHMVRRVAVALARLAARDPGGRMSNRPINSLSEMLHHSMPQSNTSVQDRLAILDGILGLELERDIGWEIALGWIQSLNGGGVLTPAQRPQILAWNLPPIHDTVTHGEAHAQINGLVERLLVRARNDSTRWAELVNVAHHLGDLEPQLLSTLRAAHPQIEDSDRKIWAALRKELYMMRLNESTENSERREQINLLFKLFEPQSLVARIAWLFAPWPDLDDPVEAEVDHDKKVEILERLRADALSELWSFDDKWDQLANLIPIVETPEYLGDSLGKSAFANELESRLLAGPRDEKYAKIVPSFGASLAWIKKRTDSNWFESKLRELVGSGRATDAARIAAVSLQDGALWNLISAIGEPLRAEFWRSIRRVYGEHSQEEWDQAIGNLLDVGREAAAVEAASMAKEMLAGTTALKVLERFRDRVNKISSADEAHDLSRDGMAARHIKRVFQVIDRDLTIDVGRVLSLAISFLPILKESKRLSDAIDKQPDLFLQLLATIYRRKNEEPLPEGEQRDKRREEAKGALAILSAWKGYPGEGLTDEEREARLEAWATEVLDKARSDGRGAIASVHVAEVLARAPNGSDGLWPCFAARRLLERGVYEKLGNHLETAKWNLRGMTGRALDEGGAQELELAKEHRTAVEQIKEEFPRTAAMLDAFARRYEAEADSYEPEARRHRIEYGEEEESPTPVLTASQEEPETPKTSLTRLEIQDVVPSSPMRLDLASRLTLLIGDNSLGKTFVLDTLWWALTGSWAGHVAKPSQGRTRGPKAKKVQPLITATAGDRQIIGRYSAAHESWSKPERPLAPGLTIYARVDGSFSVWDPLRNATPLKNGELDLSAGYHFSPDELWKRLLAKDGETVLCEGLIADAVSWRHERRAAFAMLEKALSLLSPADESLRFGLPARFAVRDARDFPTLALPYGTIFAVHASAAVKRTLGLAYVLAWSVSEIQRAALVANADPLQRVTLLIDEIEAHLYPKWQRTILRAVLGVVQELAPQADVQLVVSTHAPLVLASAEPLFDAKTDALFDFKLVDPGDGSPRIVQIEKETWQLRGDANAWLTSVFDFKEPVSQEAEQVLSEAKRLLREADLDLQAMKGLTPRLGKHLKQTDPFWVRWLMALEKLEPRKNGKKAPLRKAAS
jgi:hypothetical protein